MQTETARIGSWIGWGWFYLSTVLDDFSRYVIVWKLCTTMKAETQGKIERWHQTLKYPILLESHFLPGDLKAEIAAFVENYNHWRHHESLDNLTPADVYFRRGQSILLNRERIKRKTIEQRRVQHRKAVA